MCHQPGQDEQIPAGLLLQSQRQAELMCVSC